MSQIDTASASDAASSRKGFFGRILLFIRQVIDEVRKVVRPTREELTQYTVVVVCFIIFVMLFVVLCDQLFQRLINWIFGGDV